MTQEETNRAVSELLTMLSYKRPHGSKSERRFINRFIRPLGVKQDSFGNLYKWVGDAPILWSCHVDTVHKTAGRQELSHNENFICLPKGSTSNCLGGDCTTGVWIMINMIRAGVEGLYVFHRAEERGCLGSEHINNLRRNDEDEIEGIDKIQAAIAFDRAEDYEIITHQSYGRTCSDEFARSLALALGLEKSLSPSPHGVFTDTNEYAWWVPECTNIGVGYQHQHTSAEVQDVEWALKLLSAAVNVDITQLEISRDPSVVEYTNYGWNSYKYGNDYNNFHRDFYDRYGTSDYTGEYYTSDEKYGGSEYLSLQELVESYPSTAAQLLIDYGVNKEDFLDALVKERGYIPPGAASRS